MAIDPNSTVTHPAVRNSDPVSTDYGIVARTIGQVNVVFVPPNAANVARVPASTVVVTLIAAGAINRKTVSIFNDSTAILYIKLGAGAAFTDFTVRLRPDDFYETPDPHFIGEITGIWTAANGAAQVTEEFTT